LNAADALDAADALSQTKEGSRKGYPYRTATFRLHTSTAALPTWKGSRMRKNLLRQKLKSGEPTFSTHIHSTWPSVVEAIGHSGHYDYIEFVAEYAPYTLHDLDNLCRAAEVVNIDMMIKIDYDTHQFVAQKAIGSGFNSVLFADCHNVE
jgi:hypothetical protein